MCSSCGGGKSARLPGATAKNPIVFGSPNGVAAQPATFLVDYDKVKPGHYKYVTGDGVEEAVESGVIQIGYKSRQSPIPRRAPKLAASPDWYVKTGNNKWVGFASKPAAERYAASTGGAVQTREEVLQIKGGS